MSASPKVIARELRKKHQYAPAVASRLAQRICQAHSRCDICGIPTWVILQHAQDGGPFPFGEERTNRRLTVDHIEPGGPSTEENTRLLCYACNTWRGPAEFTDEVVLERMRAFWFTRRSLADLWWLNPGGRENRMIRGTALDESFTQAVFQW